MLQALAALWNRSMLLVQLCLDSMIKNDFLAYRHYLNVTEWQDWRERDMKLITSESALAVSVDYPMHTVDGSAMKISTSIEIAGRLQILHGAFAWTGHTSQDAHLLRAVADAVPVHTARGWHPFSRLVFDLHAVCHALSIDPRSLVPDMETCVAVEDGAAVIAKYSTVWLSGRVEYSLLVDTDSWQDKSLAFNNAASIMSRRQRVQWAHMIASDLAAILGADAYSRRNIMDKCGKQAPYYLQACTLLGLFLVWSVVRDERRTSIALDRFAALLDNLLSHTDNLDPPFRPLIGLLLWIILKCEERLGRRLFLVSAGDLRLTHLALKLPPDDAAQWSRSDCTMFVRISEGALEEWHTPRGTAETEAALPQLLERMAACAERAHILKLENCGVPYLDFRWPFRLQHLFDPRIGNFKGQHIAQALFPHHLISILARSRDAGLISIWESNYVTALHHYSQELRLPPHPINESNLTVAVNDQLYVHFPYSSSIILTFPFPQ